MTRAYNDAPIAAPVACRPHPRPSTVTDVSRHITVRSAMSDDASAAASAAASARSQATVEDKTITSTVFAIMKLALTSDMAAIDAHLADTYSRSGATGLLKLTRALAMMSMILRPDLREVMSSLGPALLAADDPRPVLDDVFAFYGEDGQPYPFDDPDVPVLVGGLLFLHACVTDTALVRERFRQAMAQGKPGVGELVRGVLMVLVSTLRSLPEQRLRELMVFQPGSSRPSTDDSTEGGTADGTDGTGGTDGTDGAGGGGPANPGTTQAQTSAADSGDDQSAPGSGVGSDATSDAVSFDLSGELKAKLLAVSRIPDDKESAQQATALLAPMLLLHGEQGLLAVCRTFAAAIADMLGMSPNAPGERRVVIPAFVDENDAPLHIDAAALADPMTYIQVLAYRFLVAYLNRDLNAQLVVMRYNSDGGSALCNGLSTIYRIQAFTGTAHDTEGN